jgi:cytoskeletal protein CcmA (bactofilin family)
LFGFVSKPPKEAFLSSSAELKGKLACPDDLVVETSFHGDLRVNGRVSMGPGAHVEGEIHAGALSIDPGAVVRAEVHIGPRRCSKGPFAWLKRYGPSFR